MSRLLLHLTVAFAILLSGSLVRAQKAGEVAIPDTPAGKRFAAWLVAFNRGDYDILHKFAVENVDKSYPSDDFARNHLALYRSDGRYQVRKVTASSSEAITVLAEGAETGFWIELNVYVTSQPPHLIQRFIYHHIEMPADLLPHKKLTDKEIFRKTDALITNLVAADQFSGIILVAKNGKPIYRRAAGLASRAWNIPNRIDTKFNIASIGKMFTSMAIVQLVEQGKLSYSDTVGKILPDYANKEMAQRVTVRHLLTHTAGLESRSIGEFRKGFRTIQEYLPSFAREPAPLNPGSQFNYSNDGYILLGAIIEKVSGQSYYDYIRDHIYQLAGMTNSDSYELDTDPPNLATGYMDGPNRTRLSNVFTLPLKGLPNGVGYSTAEDLLKFANALHNYSLVSAKSLELAWAGSETHPEYGYGFELSHYNGKRIVGHSGGWAGITNQMDIYPDVDYTVVILTNIDDSPRTIAYKLREWLTQGLP